MSFLLKPLRLFTRSVARLGLVAMVGVSVLSGAIPIASASSSHLCAMACCAGKAPHEAGSCMGGACHAKVVARKTAPEADPLCNPHLAAEKQHKGMQMPKVSTDSTGEDTAVQVNEFSFTSDESSPGQQPETPGITSGTFTKPCPPDCGATTLSSTTQPRPRDSVALSYAERPRPPSAGFLLGTSLTSTKTLETLRRQSQPRAPPASFLSA